LNKKRFFQLSTEKEGHYLLLLSVYIKKKVNPSFDCVDPIDNASTKAEPKQPEWIPM